MSPWLIVLGTFLPLIGVAITAVLGRALRRTQRWTALWLVPALTALLCWLSISPVFENGNLLAAAIYLTYFVALFLYYPVLLVVYVILRRRGGAGSLGGARSHRWPA